MSTRPSLGPGDWRVEYVDQDGGCYVAIFAGPEAERRRGNTYDAGPLNVRRAGPPLEVCFKL